MKRLVALVPLLCLAVGTACADGVTLRYRFDPVGGSPYDGRGQEVKLVSKPAQKPAKLPKLRSSKPLYGQAVLGRGGTTTFALVADESKGTGKGYDTVYVDGNRNGDLTDDTPARIALGEHAFSSTPFRLLVPIDGERVLYHARVEGCQCNKDLFRINALGYYTGTLSVAGKQYRVAVVDGNGNGLYGDAWKTLYSDQGGDVLLVDLDGNGEFEQYESIPKEVCYVGKRVVIAGRYYDLTLSPNGSTATLTPSRAPLAPVRADFPEFAAMLAGGGGLFPMESKGAAVEVPVGSYQAVTWSVGRKGPDGALWKLESAAYDEKAKVLALTVGEQGGTFSPDVSLVVKPSAQVGGKGEVEFGLEFATASGQNVSDIQVGGRRPTEPTLKVLDGTGAEVASLKFQYG